MDHYQQEWMEALGMVGFVAFILSPILVPLLIISLFTWLVNAICPPEEEVPQVRDPSSGLTKPVPPYDAGASRIPKAGPGNPWGL